MSATTNTDACKPDEADGSGKDDQVNRALVAVIAVGAVFCFGASVGWGWRVAGSVAGGVLIAAANLWILKRIAAAFLSDKSSHRFAWGMVGALKFVLLLVGMGLLVAVFGAHALPLLIGYGALPVGITVAALFGGKNKSEP